MDCYCLERRVHQTGYLNTIKVIKVGLCCDGSNVFMAKSNAIDSYCLTVYMYWVRTPSETKVIEVCFKK